MGFSETEIPSRFSLEKYAPPIREQQGGTCVGWATSYSALSILYNMENNITDPFIKWATAFDPYYIYTVSKSAIGDNTCDEGMNIMQDWDQALRHYLNERYLPLSKLDDCYMRDYGILATTRAGAPSTL